MDRYPTDLWHRPVVVGAGLAGLMTALSLAPEKVVVLAKASLARGVISAPTSRAARLNSRTG